MSATERGQARELTPLSTLLTGATALDAEAATQFALGVLDGVKVLYAAVVAAGLVDLEVLKVSLERELHLRRQQGDRARALALAIVLDGVASGRPELRGDRAREGQ